MGKHKGFTILELLITVVVIGLLIVIGWQVLKRADVKQAQAPVEHAQEQQTVKGVALSPKSFNSTDFTAFFEEAKKSGTVVSWAGEWTNLEKTGSAPFAVAGLAERYGYTPIIIVGTHRDADGGIEPIAALDAQNKTRFVTAAADFARKYKPRYLGLGNEINRIRDTIPSDYTAFQQWFKEAYAAIKKESPTTKVFTIFQYEQLLGLKGGLFGGTNDPGRASWQLLDDFPEADLIAFTTYPYLIYQDPADIPEDYYSRITSYASKPIAFTEIGWPSGTEAVGYESTPEEQSAFITRFFELSRPTRPNLAIWPFLYDQNLDRPFTTLSLIDKSGAPKPALTAWQQVKP